MRLCVLCEIIYINSSVIGEFVAAVLKLVYWIRKNSRKERKDAKILNQLEQEKKHRIHINDMYPIVFQSTAMSTSFSLFVDFISEYRGCTI